jgi:hypothetical protein
VQGDGVQDDGVQGDHARCGRSCSVAAAGGSAREQWSHAWRTSEADEEKAADEVRRHYELFVEDMEVAWCERTTALAEAERVSMARQARKEQLRSGKEVEAGATRRGFDAQRKTGGGGRPVRMAYNRRRGRQSYFLCERE